jgi:hypothetical protein
MRGPLREPVAIYTRPPRRITTLELFGFRIGYSRWFPTTLISGFRVRGGQWHQSIIRSTEFSEFSNPMRFSSSRRLSRIALILEFMRRGILNCTDQVQHRRWRSSSREMRSTGYPYSAACSGRAKSPTNPRHHKLCRNSILAAENMC